MLRGIFVSLEESGQICMLAGILGNNREIFYPKLKETQMMSFDSIATNLLKEYGICLWNVARMNRHCI